MHLMRLKRTNLKPQKNHIVCSISNLEKIYEATIIIPVLYRLLLMVVITDFLKWQEQMSEENI